MSKCKKCGAEMDNNVLFCGTCGAKRDDLPEQEESVRPVQNGIATKPGIKKLIPVIAAVIAAVIIGAVINSYKVKEIAIAQDFIELAIDESQNVFYTVSPQKASGKKVNWESSDITVAAVDESGRVTALSEGACTVTVSAGGKSAHVNIVVKKAGPDFQKIYKDLCNSKWATLASDGSYLMLDTNPNNDDDYINMDCYKAIKEVNKALGLPESVYAKMGETRSLDGRQTHTADGFTVSWTYHPDKGMEVMYEIN